VKRKNKGLVRRAFGGLALHPCGGFTTVELLITIAIISMLVGILIPALTMVRTAARNAKQMAQLTAIELALGAFKSDYGDYPPSDCGQPFNYCGAQKLSEALLGWDLRGFHPRSAWRADGHDAPPPIGTGNWVYESIDANLQQRKGPYLELATANVFRLGDSPAGDGLFDPFPTTLATDRYVICDIFPAKRVEIAPGKTTSAGIPVLYYRANTSSKNIDDPDFTKRIYDFADNLALVVDLKEQEDRSKHGSTRIWNPLYDSGGNFKNFYDYITDPKVTARAWPYRPDSYLLISAGADGFYGTEDDICNFGN
jgi:type II secretory pathway pseudopilin PulG